jgi:hypothetical protein
VLLDGKLAKATAQIVVFLRQHFDLLLDLIWTGIENHTREKKKKWELLKRKKKIVDKFSNEKPNLILVLPDGGDDFLHLLEEFSFAGRTRHWLTEWIVDWGQQWELFVQVDFRVLQRIVQQVIAVQFSLLLINCQ